MIVGFNNNSNNGQPNMRVLLNDGLGILTDGGSYLVPGTMQTQSIAIGYLDGDGIVDLGDLPGFVACLLDPAPALCLIADMNGDGSPDGLDIPLFVDALLGR